MAHGVATYVSKADILDKGRVEVRSFPNLLEQSIHHVFERSILETTFLGLCERGSSSEGDDNVIRILRLTVMALLDSVTIIRSGHRDSHAVERRPRGQVLDDGTNTFSGHCVCSVLLIDKTCVSGWIMIKLRRQRSWL